MLKKKQCLQEESSKGPETLPPQRPSRSLSLIASNQGSFNKSAAVGRFAGSYCRISLNNTPTAFTSTVSISGGASPFQNVSSGSVSISGGSISVPENQPTKSHSYIRQHKIFVTCREGGGGARKEEKGGVGAHHLQSKTRNTATIAHEGLRGGDRGRRSIP
jgi:hypothetical protein